MRFKEARTKIHTALTNKNMCVIVGECSVEYNGRAHSNLPLGKRMILIKADGSLSVHENRLIRPTNYMMNTKISCEIKTDKKILELQAKRNKPKETITIEFTKIIDVNNYDLPESNDIRLVGSEKELNEALMEDLSFLETGLKPINQQQYFRTGICDIIAEDAKGRLVVIELKRRQADYSAVTQLKRYAETVQKMKGIKTRGILLAPSIRKSALELLKKYGLEYFSYDFEIKEKSKIKGINKTQMKINEY
ncbi:MAG: endonuclease NucS [Candidatus Diapherotrites archaeon]|uniref:Endonuclease NucS n=1 Tax=Candidatus Iainarchaeum sp. TaxID=3101447 RepID=A0A7K4BYP0_9ARCH|nr:endonuclease NucS [Candidatus Diapherotrites archaeon]